MKTLIEILGAVKPTHCIRPAVPADLFRIAELSDLHAEYERESGPRFTRDCDRERLHALSQLFFAPDPAMTCLVVEVDQTLEGYATFGQQFSTWQAQSYLYLDCLFLTPSVRRLGIGRAMMQRIRQEAVAKGMSEIQWQTPEFNHDAIRFYQRLGAKSQTKQRFSWKVKDDHNS